MYKNEEKKYHYLDIKEEVLNLKLSTTMIVEGFMLGLHKSPFHGFSSEFTQHRSYSIGDNVKFIDWKLYGKLEKYYIKQFEDETNLYTNIFIDNTSSMDFKGKDSQYSKLEYAHQLAAAIARILLSQNDSVGLGIYSDKLEYYQKPSSQETNFDSILQRLVSSKTYPAHNTFPAFEEMMMLLQKPGITVLISDFLEDPKIIASKIHRLSSYKQDIIIFMIADPVEYNFNFKENYYNFIDSETNQKINLSSKTICKDYRNHYQEHIQVLKQMLNTNRIAFKFTTTSTRFDIPLMEMLLFKNRSI